MDRPYATASFKLVVTLPEVYKLPLLALLIMLR
jgi:hypothetical protein